MDARDFRGLGRPAQEALRRRALFLVEREGMAQAEAARAVGVHRRTVNVWHERYRERGEDGLLDGRRVSPRRGKGLLAAEEAGKVRGWVAEGTPDRPGLPFALWTSRAVRELIERRLAKRLGLATVQLYPRRWGMTPRKPLVRARQRRPAAIAAWLERDYPAIARRARAAKAVAYWGERAGGRAGRRGTTDRAGAAPRATTQGRWTGAPSHPPSRWTGWALAHVRTRTATTRSAVMPLPSPRQTSSGRIGPGRPARERIRGRDGPAGTAPAVCHRLVLDAIDMD